MRHLANFEIYECRECRLFAYEQMRSLGYYHLYRHRSSEPAVARHLNDPTRATVAKALFE
jgi:hypothetical protein